MMLLIYTSATLLSDILFVCEEDSRHL